MRVAVVGGGIGGLASAYFLLEHGHVPVVFEAAEQLGGLGAQFRHDGVELDRFYHVILDSDLELRRLIATFGLEVVWRETGMGFHLGGRLYGFNTPADLLRFRALPLSDRLRTGVGALYITRLKRRGLDLDNRHAVEWLRRLFGRRVFERVWDPLLRAKFGDRRSVVPAYWVWNLLNREKNGSQEVKGYVRGGYRALTQALHAAITRGGGEIRVRAPVTAVEAIDGGARVVAGGESARYDAVISTLPLPLLARVAGTALAARLPSPDLAYQGVVNAVVVSRRRLERFYWTVVVDPRFPFQGAVETTHVLPPEWIGGRHVVYLMNYCDAASELYARPDEVVQRQAMEGLAAIYPRFDRTAVEGVYVFRAPHVEPVWSVGYLQRRPQPRIGATRVYLSTTAQAYPRVTAWNTSVALAGDSVSALISDLAPTARPAHTVNVRTGAFAPPAASGRANDDDQHDHPAI